MAPSNRSLLASSAPSHSVLNRSIIFVFSVIPSNSFLASSLKAGLPLSSTFPDNARTGRPNLHPSGRSTGRSPGFQSMRKAMRLIVALDARSVMERPGVGSGGRAGLPAYSQTYHVQRIHINAPLEHTRRHHEGYPQVKSQVGSTAPLPSKKYQPRDITHLTSRYSKANLLLGLPNILIGKRNPQPRWFRKLID